MYRAVLVDDETFDLEGMRVLIPWEELGIQVVCSEEKPLAALQYIEGHEIDLLITDIKMPVLSGLELSRKAQERNPRLKTVFISGYQDFEYAKQAMHLKADGYILKPVDDQEIIETLQRVVAELDRTQMTRSEETARMIASFEFIRNDFVQHLLEGTVDTATLHAFLQSYPFSVPEERAPAVLIELDDVLWKYGPPGSTGRPDAQRTVRSVGALIEAGGLGPWCPLSESQVGLLYTAGDGEPAERLGQLCADIAERGEGTVTISLGDAERFPDGTAASFRQAKERMALKMFLGKNRVIRPDADAGRGSMAKEARDLQAVLDEIFAAMTSYGLVAICDCVDDLFAVVETFEHPVKVRSFSIHIATKLETYLHTLNESFSSLLGWGIEHLERILEFETIDDIKSWYRRTLFEIAEKLFLRKNGKNRRLIEQIEQYVRESLSEDLTLKEVANHFSYSPNHLGYLFKEHTGESFNEYLVKLRMERAKELLRDPRFKIYEIAELVGYKSLAYFSRQFRERFGLTPGDYRKQS
ncbi:helix-turn-helix domain-containing protein [Paenibacillus mucilaginosus]|uniref:Two component transcriptional regulator, AraC family n=1 Tax=Paenibacillus mucilaginosus (strain KNP414) TaxID=1036673 RepID=F8FKB0_PAEMK|nr:helix-turn-helix domain-containing protein [Paenibacillus mucilaginosus]AEI44791.1 two component transcriptional regulator, AraC family [Paenibacillus mucilaginosus KNP414]MCG7214840.1 helix-turn-helix domain-containing protein [Paenibacillus mucilaginosus]WDM26322.1 response regulator transcription factor [Paenibacillus mucilaginosus]